MGFYHSNSKSVFLFVKNPDSLLVRVYEHMGEASNVTFKSQFLLDYVIRMAINDFICLNGN